jgi:hypothetical protein
LNKFNKSTCDALIVLNVLFATLVSKSVLSVISGELSYTLEKYAVLVIDVHFLG